MRLSPGTRLGPYEIAALLGAGGMGEVYRARDTRLDRTVAIKVIPVALSSDPVLKERFEREARTVAALNHPNICVLHDVGHHDGLDFLVMEHIAGEPLAARMKKGPLPLDQVLHFGVQIADALDRAHRAGVVHRDLKPGNIMIAGTGAAATVKLLDFGLAKLTPPAGVIGTSQAQTAERDLTGEGSILGTVQYMAPEQLEAGEVDTRSDIFALGAVLYEMATGRRAFEGKSQVSVIAAILEHQPTPISKLQPLTPPAFEHVVATCLAKSPDDRWQTARDVARELKWIGAHPTAGPQPAAVRQHSRWLGWTAAAAAVVALLAAGGVAWRLSTPASSREVMRFEVPTPAMPNPLFISVSPDGRRLAFVASDPATSRPVIYVRNIDAVAAQKLDGTDFASSPFWSPDGRYIGFAVQRQVKRIDVSGGPPQTICDFASVAFLGGAWNADNVIVFGQAQGPLMRVPATGGQASAVTKLGDGELSHAWPAFLPDGQRFLVTVLRPAVQQRAIKWGSLDGPQLTELLRANSSALYSPSGHLLFHRDGTLLAQPFDPAALALNGEPTRIAESLAFNPQSTRMAAAVSHTGVLVFKSGAAFEATQLTWFDRRGARIGTTGDPAAYRGIALSPDGRYLAVHIHQEPSGGDVWIMDRERGTSRKFTFNAHNFAPSWSRDGQYVLFTSDKEGALNLYRKAAGGGTGDEMAFGSGGAAYVEDLSRNGEWMIYGTCGTQTGCDVYRVPLTRSGKPEPLVTSASFDGLSKLSPDERWLAYESDETGQRQIYVRPYPAGPAIYQISTEGGRYVRWSPRGDELFYLKDDGTMMAVDVRTEGTALIPGAPKALFRTNPLLANHRGSALDIPYDVTQDGQRFIVNERLSTTTQQSPISVVVNWTALLSK